MCLSFEIWDDVELVEFNIRAITENKLQEYQWEDDLDLIHDCELHLPVPNEWPDSKGINQIVQDYIKVMVLFVASQHPIIL